MKTQEEILNKLKCPDCNVGVKTDENGDYLCINDCGHRVDKDCNFGDGNFDFKPPTKHKSVCDLSKENAELRVENAILKTSLTALIGRVMNLETK